MAWTDLTDHEAGVLLPLWSHQGRGRNAECDVVGAVCPFALALGIPGHSWAFLGIPGHCQSARVRLHGVALCCTGTTGSKGLTDPPRKNRDQSMQHCVKTDRTGMMDQCGCIPGFDECDACDTCDAYDAYDACDAMKRPRKPESVECSMLVKRPGPRVCVFRADLNTTPRKVLT